MRTALVLVVVVSGCMNNHTIEIDRSSLEVPRGASSDVRVSVDGVPVTDLDAVLWEVDDPSIATVVPAWDGVHLRVGGNREGETTIHINVHGQTIALPTRIGPPAIMQMWIEPATVMTSVGDFVQVRAIALDTVSRIREVTRDSRWAIRDPSIAVLDSAGMMVYAVREGHTTLHATSGGHAMVVPITIVK